MIEALVGGLYTFAIIAVAFVFGYQVGQRSEVDVLHEMRQAIHKKQNRTGPIKPTPKHQREQQEHEYMKKFIDEL